MKKITTTLLLLAAINFYSQAQWVSIPDTNFGTWLNTNNFNMCLQGNNTIGWQIDTTCPAMVNATWLTLSNSGIRNLSGVQYFDNLEHLWCENNLLIGLPPLPDSLIDLSCTDNLLASLPVLPGGLKRLYCFSNQLTSLPALPNTITDFYCGNNQLTGLPSLPIHLYDFNCDNNLLTSLPALPDSLIGFSCQGNQLTSLPDLPDTLTICHIQNNPIICLPQLTRILSLNFSNTLVTCKPNIGNVTNSTPSLQNLPLCQPGNANGCAYDTCAGFQIDSITTTNVSCFGGNDGSACVYVSGGMQPYGYFWSNFNATQCNSSITATTYSVNVIDNNGCSASTSVNINEPSQFQIEAIASADSICSGQQVQLSTNIVTASCGVSAPCSGNSALGIVGTDTMMITGFSQTPAILGNFYKSYRNQILYKASELSAILGGAKTIDSLAFKVRQFNSVALLENYTIKIGCTADDSLIEWNNSLTQVFLGNNIQPHSGWNTFKLNQSFYWDGISNLIVEVCVYCSNTFGNMTNPVESSTTPFTSYLYSYGSSNLCGSDSTKGYSALRPNIKFSYCTPNFSNYQYSWLPSNGLNSVADDTLQNTAANPVASTNYYITATNLEGCTATDSVTVFVTNLRIDSITTTNVSCFGGNDGSACAYASGGGLPYDYAWSSGPNTQCITGLTANPYTVTVSDTSGCAATATASITQPSALQTSLSTVNATCNVCDGQAMATVSGGVFPYMYEYDPGVNLCQAITCNLLCSGIPHLFVVTDMNGCVDSTTFSVGQSSTLQIDSIITTDASCSISNGSILVYASGGVNPYTYSLNGGPTQAQNLFSGLGAGPYQVTVYDDNGCYDTASVNVLQSTGPSLQVTSATSGALPDTLCATVTGGVPPYLYNWSGNVSGLPNMCFELLSGAFSITVEDANGCTATYSTNSLCPNQCVWPGDADYNGIADNNDLLPIGLAYGKNGPARLQQDINWYAHPATDWIDTITTTGSGSMGNNIITVASSAGISLGMEVSGVGIATGAVVTSLAGTTLALNRANTGAVNGTLIFTTPSISSGVNSKQIDCDGNGTINADDTLAILQNFGLTHAKTNDQRPWRMTDPSMYVELTPDTTHAGDTMYAYITLGDIGIPANDVYGLAFTFNYDASVVDSTRTAVTFGNSWLGNATDKISLAKNFHPLGQIKCALTRIDHATRSGFGQIGQVSFVITTDNINGKNLAYYQMNVYITDLVMIDNLGNYITVNEGKDSSLVEFEELEVGNGQLQVAGYRLQVHPNPATDEVQFTVSDNLIGGEVKIMDVEGRVLLQKGISVVRCPLSVAHLSQGLYFIQVRTEKGMLTKRLVIAR